MGHIPDSQEISIKNQSKPFKYGDVKNLIVKIGNYFYLKQDPDLVKIPNEDGKLRFFRKDSPLLVCLDSGEYVHKSNCIVTEDQLYFKKGSQEVVEVDGKWVRKIYTLQYKGKHYFKTDPNFVLCYKSQEYIPKDEAIKIDSKIYGEKAFISKAYESQLITTHFGSLVFEQDARHVMNPDGSILQITAHEQSVNKIRLHGGEIFWKFQDETNPQENRVTYIRLIKKGDESLEDVCTSLEFAPGFLYYVNNYHVDKIKKIIEDVIMPRKITEIEKVRKKINANYSDLDPTENVAKSFTIISGPWPGKLEIHIPSNYGGVIATLPGKKTNSFEATAGLEYSFGVEFETSQGILPNEAMAKVKLKAVGDRSIGAAEYVSLPLEGDAGLLAVKNMCEVLNASTLVDDKCGLHVHVGGLNEAKRPSFNKEFIKNAINLGCLLEEELYRCMPESRVPTLYHCHSIRRFGPVTDKNYADNVGAYIFGEKEKWVTKTGEPTKLWPFSNYTLGPGRNSNSSVGTWADGRYKWLNLIHSFLNQGPKTIEFRIFPGTTSYEKTLAYILFSMAFTDIVDNHPNLIKQGVTIEKILIKALEKNKAVRDFVIDFYEQRKKKFNRSDIYPKHESLTFLK